MLVLQTALLYRLFLPYGTAERQKLHYDQRNINIFVIKIFLQKTSTHKKETVRKTVVKPFRKLKVSFW